ncbi:LPD7 domain-containing protein [Sphingomonas montanisoli]|uniref:LPD7 domain-containing protein n=1 Tax=Sphingomonas montanisoli TaxID=2606412 RepID=UPI0015E171A7|nr:LPD7 domain-containing protein [Sphingomonas montanisoli]
MTMAESDRKQSGTARTIANSVGIDAAERGKAQAPGSAPPEKSSPGGAKDSPTESPDHVRAAGALRSAPKVLSLEAGDVPDSVRKRYYADKAKWSGEPAFFTTAQAKDPAFRDQGRRLVTATESQEVVKDLVAIAQHRNWDRIHVTGSEEFRRSVWIEASQKGLEVRGYKPNDRDLQELDRLRGETNRNSIAPMAAARDLDAVRGSSGTSRQSDGNGLERPDARRGDRGNTPNDRAADSQMRVMEAVIRRTLFDNPEAVARVMTVARTQLDAHIAAGRNIRPAMVKDASPNVRQDIVRGRDPATPPIPRPGREPKPQERSRSR